MKKMRFAALLLPFMMLASLTGCGNNDKQYDDFCARAADAAPLLLNSVTGKEIFASEKTRILSDYTSVLALNSFTFQEKELAIEWELSPKEKWVDAPYVVDNTRDKMSPVYGKEAYDTSIKCTVSCLVEGKKHGKAELSWKFHVEATNVKELSLQQISESYVANGNKLGDMAGKDDEGNDIVVGTRGIITATFEQPDDVYSGVFIQDGEHAIQLYAGSLSSLWVENQLKVGDCIFAVGKLEIYDSFIEMKPTLLEAISQTGFNIKDPVTINLDEKTYDGTLMVHQSTVATMSGLKFKSAEALKKGVHASLSFTKDDLTITVYVNYHVGETVINALNELVDTWYEHDEEGARTTAKDVTVGVKGILTFHESVPQIIPIFGVDSFILPTA